MRTVAHRYSVSDVALAQMCRKLGVPFPAAGTGPNVPRGALRLAPPCPAWTAGRAHRGPRGAGPSTGAANADVLALHPGRDERPIVVAAAAPRGASAGGARSPPRAWLSCRSRPCVDVQVVPGSLERAIPILTSLVTALEACGFRPRPQPPPRARPAIAGHDGSALRYARPGRRRALAGPDRSLPVGRGRAGVRRAHPRGGHGARAHGAVRERAGRVVGVGVGLRQPHRSRRRDRRSPRLAPRGRSRPAGHL